MDYNKLEEMISNHLCHISSTLKTANDEVPDPEYLKCVAASKQLPPAMVRKSGKNLMLPKHAIFSNLKSFGGIDEFLGVCFGV
jgi:hypothetical protein